MKNEDGSITISFKEKYSKYFIKVDDFNIFDYRKIILVRGEKDGQKDRIHKTEEKMMIHKQKKTRCHLT